ncbi:eukaryotic translation initiation factor 5A-2 [Micractinium conductrix]|uniref:sn-1-specific diacylglycerol lipase n=1 Tax=Micractinium conductrix TaxID=554055 RepID=A0A2P6VNF7_9CHLO|nr:eukaryotic translation initiation factor 5A-2 [Micractinium conductrix]|eukprot:PSC75585.1 eukaryotic translation initiation factor 5A-2 [Micractinium conductrix]
MPALVLFNRRWLLAGDDVPLVAAPLFLIHTVWCCLLVIWYISLHGPRECSGALEYDVAVGGLLGAFLLSAGLEFGMVKHGLRGGPFETRARRLLPRLIYLDFASHVAQVAFNGYGTHIVYSGPSPVCPTAGLIWNPVNAMLALVWCTWALIAALLLLLVLTYNIFPDYTDPKSWERRCNCIGTLLCCRRGDRGQYRDLTGQQQRLSTRLGGLFAMMLAHIDLSATDMLLAFSLAMALQRMQRRQQREMAAAAGHPVAQHSSKPAFGRRPSRAGMVQLSPQMSPGSSSWSSTDELLPGRRPPDLETGLLGSSSQGGGSGMARHLAGIPERLLGRKGDANGDGGACPAAAAAAAGEHLEGLASFVPAHDEGGEEGDLQVGAEKTEEDECGQPRRPDSREGELGPVDAETLREAAWAMKYAFASYGLLLFIFSQPATGCLQVCCGRNCGLLLGTAGGRRGRRKLDLRLVHNLNREATQQAAGLADADLLDVRYEGEVPHVLPYFIAVDENARALVIAIRGSLSLDDVVRDLLFEPASLDEWVVPGRRWEDPPPELVAASAASRYAAHSGILEAARATFMDIQEHGVLHSALLAPGGRCDGYRLVVTGHSLGAGCAFLLALYLRHFCPGLRCWSFSPPGGLASGELCAAASEWCTSTVCGREWIPRLSMRTFSRMRDEMILAALRCRRSKWIYLLSVATGRRWTEDELFYRPDELPEEARLALRSYRASLARNTAVRTFLELSGDFCPPGRCFQLKPTGKAERTGPRWRGAKRRQYRAVFLEGTAVVDEGIIISGRMMADHMPDYLLATLRQMARSISHSQCTATVNDLAGERLAEHVFHPGGSTSSNYGGSEPGSSRRRSGGGASGGGDNGRSRRWVFGSDSPCTMSDHEDHGHDVHFESADAGASLTYPQQAGTVRKNAYIVIKGRPCKVADVSTSKTGKHGHAKCAFVAIDIFTGKKMEDLSPSSHNVDVPHVSRTDYTLLDITDDGFVSLMTEGGDTKDDLQLPSLTDEATKLAEQIKADFDAGKELCVSVMKAMGEEQICAYKVTGQGS